MAGENYRAMERIVKGFANHRRLQILDMLKREPELSMEQISERLNSSYHNISDHLRKMAIAGLVVKRNQGYLVLHRLTPRGEGVLLFCKKLK